MNITRLIFSYKQVLPVFKKYKVPIYKPKCLQLLNPTPKDYEIDMMAIERMHRHPVFLNDIRR
jgi:hypothetical protein